MRCRSTVKWFDARRGFGFIVIPEDQKLRDSRDLFVHHTQIVTDEPFRVLRTGDCVEFDLVSKPKGYHAERVVVVNDAGA